jgi:hypothetical protein
MILGKYGRLVGVSSKKKGCNSIEDRDLVSSNNEVQFGSFKWEIRSTHAFKIGR